jgi:hypothetical protein
MAATGRSPLAAFAFKPPPKGDPLEDFRELKPDFDC